MVSSSGAKIAAVAMRSTMASRIARSHPAFSGYRGGLRSRTVWGMPVARGALSRLEVAAAATAAADALHESLPALLEQLVACGPVFVAAVDPTTLHFTRT